MDAMKTCHGCRKPLSPQAPDGLCPECLTKAGLPTGASIAPDSRSENERIPFTAPLVEDVDRLFPQLEILGMIGQGGMGAVYRARQKELDRVVALKLLPPDIGRDLSFAERFTREARALAKLNHSGIVTLYEFGRADGLYFFLMEFVDGVNLRQLLEAGRLSPREALAIVPQICDALQYAHDQGIVHRDIKPENILLDRQGRVKVADFGLAKLVGARDQKSSDTPASMVTGTILTEAGKVMGTPQYMAPEQRERPTEVDHRADIYSLGVVFYHMLTGELPGQRIEPPSHKVRLDVRLDEVVLHALEHQPERRYQQASQLKTDVEAISSVQNPPTAGRPTATSANAGLSGSASAVPVDPSALTSDRGLPGARPWTLVAALTVTMWFAAASLVGTASSALRLNESLMLFLFAGLAMATPFIALAASRFVSRWLGRDDPEARAAGIRWLRAWAWVAWLMAMPMIGMGLFFVNALASETGGWHPATAEAVIVPLIWLGTLILPFAGWRLWGEASSLRNQS